ncbi:MAG: ABC transporter permease [Eubacteriales bacterium]|jgi:hypothetical protein
MRYAGRIRQTNIYVGKLFRIFANEKQWKGFISATIITALIASVTGKQMFTEYSATRNGTFALICACIWIGIFNSIQSVCSERGIIKREHRSGLHMTSYVTAHMVFEFFQSAVDAAIVTAVTVFIFGSNMRDADGFKNVNYLLFYVTFFLIIYASDVLGMMVSCIVKTPETAMTVMPFVLIIQLVMCGFIFELKGKAAVIGKITISKWGMNALGTIANINKMKPAEPSPTASQEDYVKALQARFLADKYHADYNPAHLHVYKMWLILIGFILLYMVVSTLFLEFIDRDRR